MCVCVCVCVCVCLCACIVVFVFQTLHAATCENQLIFSGSNSCVCLFQLVRVSLSASRLPSVKPDMMRLAPRAAEDMSFRHRLNPAGRSLSETKDELRLGGA